MSNKLLMRWFCFFILFIPPVFAHGHSGSNSFFEIQSTEYETTGSWWISIKDLQVAIGLDANLDDQISYSEYENKVGPIVEYANQHFQLKSQGNSCSMQWHKPSLSRLDDGVYVNLPFSAQCQNQQWVDQINYSAMFAYDTIHRAIVKLNRGEENRVLIFSPDNQQQNWDVSGSTLINELLVYIEQGVIHILEGYDHLLFLMALLVPIVFSRSALVKTSRGKQSKQYQLWKLALAMLSVVTAFTVGHSVTLILATVFSITPPAVWVESLIAVSVVIAGINIVIPLFRETSWRIALLFGLIHGFGFASVLAELSLDKATLAISLFSFNIGVEMGQFLVVLVATPILIGLAILSSRTPMVARLSVATSSIAIAIGSFWVVERLPF